jgi:signal peptidase I
MTSRKILGALILGLLAFGATKLILAGRWYTIPQNGMYPGLPAGSYLLVRPHAYRTASEVQRGDIVVFQRTENAAAYTFIWRVVGVPGDSVQVEGRRVAINGANLRRQPVRENGALAIFVETNAPASYEVAYPKTADVPEPPTVSLTVPVEQFFVLGDNRYDARDSRYFGPIPFAAITGKKVWAP